MYFFTFHQGHEKYIIFEDVLYNTIISYLKNNNIDYVIKGEEKKIITIKYNKNYYMVIKEPYKYNISDKINGL